MVDISVQFQTPKYICDYMVSLIPKEAMFILEPTKGIGNLENCILNSGRIVTAPDDYFNLPKASTFDSVVMNPPFTPMKLGYKILFECMDRSDSIIALMPWLTLINGEKRTLKLKEYGLKSVTHLPRTAFKGSRVQCCIIEMAKGYQQKIELILL